MSDHEIQILESKFPALSGDAFAAARKRALDAGLSVVESFGNTLYRIDPDGNRQTVKTLECPTPVVPGTKIKLW